MGVGSRAFKRQKQRQVSKDAKSIMQQAMQRGAEVESQIKQIVSTLPLFHRLWIAIKILFKRWR